MSLVPRYYNSSSSTFHCQRPPTNVDLALGTNGFQHEQRGGGAPQSREALKPPQAQPLVSQEIDSWTDGHGTHMRTDKETNKTGEGTDRQTDKQIDRQTDRWTGRQMDRQTDGKTDRQGRQ